MRIMFGMFLFAFWVFSTQKCETVIFTRFGLACMHARPLNYLDMPIYLEHMDHAHVHMSRMPNMMSLGFPYNVNHIIMLSFNRNLAMQDFLVLW